MYFYSTVAIIRKKNISKTRLAKDFHTWVSGMVGIRRGWYGSGGPPAGYAAARRGFGCGGLEM